MGKKRALPGTRKKTADTVKPELDADGLVASPIDVHDRDDPGDATQRAYRYQYAYGVILLAGMATKQLAYTSLWCEYHDDYLAQLGEKLPGRNCRGHGETAGDTAFGETAGDTAFAAHWYQLPELPGT